MGQQSLLLVGLFLTTIFCIPSAFGFPMEVELVIHNREVMSSADNYRVDSDILSPKSVAFHPNGDKFYIHSLEGYNTTVYQWPSAEKISTISHSFEERDQNLFLNGETSAFDDRYTESSPKDKNVFRGKPVESVFSHDGRYLWVSYYRRSFDRYAQSPSAVAIIDTQTDQVIRVMPTGPLPKFLAASPDGQFLAVSLWGNNTIGLIDISSADPFEFAYAKELIVEKKLDTSDMSGSNRDQNCGFCLRGTAFSPDSSRLYVARMSRRGPGVAVFNMEQKSYMGTVTNLPQTPRHLKISNDGQLYVSSNSDGYISRIQLTQIEEALESSPGQRVPIRDYDKIRVGSGARTFDFSKNGRYLFATANNSSYVVAVELGSDLMKIVDKVKVSPFPVGLAVSPDNYVVTTSQGKSGHGGGNAVDIIRWE